MKIFVEDTIPFGEEYFSTLGAVRLYAWQSLTPADLRECDYLIVRSTTRVTPDLLSQADKLKLVTTATAGINHLDTDYLGRTNIAWDSAAGCNAVAVAEYVISAMLRVAQDKRLNWPAGTVGIVGAGNVGTALAARLNILNIPYKLCDPLREKAGDPRTFVSLDEILSCDVVSLHVPFTRSGVYATEKMIGQAELKKLNSKQVLINACRGEVIDEAALQQRCEAQDAPTVVLDVYENEPNIDTRTLSMAWLATPHIAGHTVEGKVRGTQMVYEQVCRAMGLTPTLSLSDFLEATLPAELSLSEPHAEALTFSDLCQVWFTAYDIEDDNRHFRQCMAKSNQFASLRKHYRVRRECSAYTLLLPQPLSAGIQRQLNGLGFYCNTSHSSQETSTQSQPLSR